MEGRTEWLNRPMTKEAARYWLNAPLKDKIAQTCVNISDWDIFTNGNWYISFSGGKDSTVLLYIAAAMLDRMPVQPHPLRVLFCDTGLEYPEIRKFVPWYLGWLEEKFPRITIAYTRRRPEKDYLDVIQGYGYPVISKEVSQIIKGARDGTPVFVAKINGEYEGKIQERRFFKASKIQIFVERPVFDFRTVLQKNEKRTS